jgi:cardiolipin synthase
LSLTNIIYTINFLLILWFVFYQNKNYRISLKWLLLFLLIPLFSFVLYFFLGKGISINKKKYLQVKERVNRLFKEDNLKLKVNDQELDKQVKLNVKLDGYNLTYYNKIDYLCSGEQFYSTLFFDISKAKSSIHIQMYIIRDDKLKDELMELRFRHVTARSMKEKMKIMINRK